MTSIPQISKHDIFLLLVSLENLSHSPGIENSHWLREDVQYILDKIFREKLMV